MVTQWYILTWYSYSQHFWGTMVASSKAGPEPVPYKRLTAEKLAEGIRYCMTDEAARAAAQISEYIERDGDGAENACRSFYRHLSLSGKKSDKMLNLRRPSSRMAP